MLRNLLLLVSSLLVVAPVWAAEPIGSLLTEEQVRADFCLASGGDSRFFNDINTGTCDPGFLYSPNVIARDHAFYRTLYRFYLWPDTADELGLHNVLMMHREDRATGERKVKWTNVEACLAGACAFQPYVTILTPPVPPVPPEAPPITCFLLFGREVCLPTNNALINDDAFAN